MRIYDFLAKKYQGRGRMHMRDQESKRSLLFVPSVWCLTFKVLFCLRCSRLFEIMIINIGVKVDALFHRQYLSAIGRHHSRTL
ncbi:hypothetical protein A244_24974 [Pseudomonas syringae pv. actinidiae ICMP 18807]|uniref:Uncharacterized protein n=1 Tax=Pseudomonas syringae pv. actinidiae ICMP 18807 TaxID=1194404 RepID=S6TRE6_PSESF|nr:hypothetical protein A244_24974 [Pseudomonas syringae pv. actinidiae ICMP 18807]